jgi:hypothetical protein
MDFRGLSCDGSKSDVRQYDLWELMGTITSGHRLVYYNDVNTLLYPLQKGLIKLQREMRAFPADGVTQDPPTSWSPNPLPGWQTNPGTTNWPPWWSWAYDIKEKEADNTFFVIFNCCCPNQKPRFKDTAPGEDLDYDESQ